MAVSHLLPVFAPDYSGVLSVLYPFRAMVVLCSAGSCAPCYADFDEFRPWPETMRVFSTQMNELDAITGAEGTIDKICAAVDPAVDTMIVLAGTPVSGVLAMDLHAIAKEVQERTKIPAFSISTDGFRGYEQGVSSLLLAMGKKFFDGTHTPVPGGVNLLGYSPYCHGSQEALNEIRELLSDLELPLICDWSVADDPRKSFQAIGTELNLVLSESGIALAEWLKATWGIPYRVVCPAGLAGLRLLAGTLCEALGRSLPEPLLRRLGQAVDADERLSALVLGEPVFAEALCRSLREDFGFARTDAVCYAPQGVLPSSPKEVRVLRNEEQLYSCLNGFTGNVILADPLYRPLANKSAILIDFPHQGLSGGLFSPCPWVGDEGSRYIKKYLEEKTC